MIHQKCNMGHVLTNEDIKIHSCSRCEGLCFGDTEYERNMSGLKAVWNKDTKSYEVTNK